MEEDAANDSRFRRFKVVDNILRGRGFPSLSPGIGGFEFARVDDDGRLALNESDGALNKFGDGRRSFRSQTLTRSPVT